MKLLKERSIYLKSGQVLRPVESTKPGGLTNVFPLDTYVDTPDRLPTLEHCVRRVEIHYIAALTK